MENNILVLATTIKPEKKKRVFAFNLGVVIFDEIVRFLKRAFTREIIVEKAIYSKILTVTDKGVEVLDELPKNIMLFISKQEDE